MKHKLCLYYRRKLQSKLNETEESLRNLETKYSSLEKTKARIAAELEDVNLDLEKVNNTQNTTLTVVCMCVSVVYTEP